MIEFDVAQLTDDKDIAETACAPVQTEEYNQTYRDWRCRDDNLFVFRGRLRQNLHTYVDGIGLQKNGPAKQERSALRNVSVLIADAALLYAAVENVLLVPLLLLFKAFGVEVSYSFNDNIAYGNQYAVLCVLLFESLLKHLVPILLVHKQVKMPKKAAYPMKIRDLWYTGTALGALCIGFFIAGFLRQFFPMEIFNVSNIGMTYEVISYMDGWCSSVYLIFEMVITPILAEVLFHGMLFQTLRQFGVSYAILIIAFLNTTMQHDPVAFAMVFVTSVAAGYGVWQSGSLLTGILVHIISRMLNFVLFQSEKFGIIGNMWFLFIVLFVGLVLSGALLLVRKGKWQMRDYTTFLPMKEKVRIAVCSGPMLITWGLCFLLMMIEIFI